MRSPALAATLFVLAPMPALAQSTGTSADTVASWVALTAPPAWEHVAEPSLRRVLTGWQRGALGSWVLQKGTGSPHRVVACSIDRPAFVVSAIREDGWLRVHPAGRASPHPLWAQQHEGQRALIITRGATVPALFATVSTHLRGRGAAAGVATAEDLYIDVGASNAAAVAQLGIRVLDPVVRDWPAWSYDGGAAGLMAGARAGCAAIASAGARSVTSGTTTFIIATLGGFSSQGLGAALARAGRIDALTIVGPGAAAATTRTIAVPAYVPRAAGLDSVTIVTPAVRWPGALTETISAAGADSIRSVIAASAGVAPGAWLMLPPPAPPRPAPDDSLHATSRLLSMFADMYGVSGHEGTVRAALLKTMPAWARERAQVDDAGNVIVAFGPERDTAVFLAHMDETGYEVRSIAPDGTVALTTRGGMLTSLWEGQPALLHFDAADGAPTRAPLRGVFVPRAQAETKQPGAITAWFGADSATLARAGVRIGSAVTSPKYATRLGATRFTARSLDDRAGTTAQLLALGRIDPQRVTRKTIFIWTVEEETGLIGAAAVAERYGTTVRLAYSIDTFVSSDSPLESTRFALARLGEGPVLRALDSSSSATPMEMDRIANVARSVGVTMRAHTTSGGTDGSTMVRFGAQQAGLSWPGRYSHSPVEVLDLRDLEQLSRVIAALAQQ